MSKPKPIINIHTPGDDDQLQGSSPEAVPQRIMQPAIIQQSATLHEVGSRQQLRLSAEGLLDIVTEQYVDAKMSASIINKNHSASNNGSLSKELSVALAEAEKLQQA